MSPYFGKRRDAKVPLLHEETITSTRDKMRRSAYFKKRQEPECEAMGKLRVYVDRMSQPARAVLIFCKLNKIDFEEHVVNLGRLEHKRPEFKAINPLGQVPAIEDGGYSLFESHAILRYLACAYPTVPDHWYPADLSKRAKIDSVLDWHHANLRRGSAGLVFNRVLAPAFGKSLNPQAASEAEILLKASLSNIETIWLKGGGKYLLGSYQPSIADLSLACEVMQLELLSRNDIDILLGPYEKLKKWMENVKQATKPHFEEVHEVLYKASQKFHRGSLQSVSKVNGVGSSARLTTSKL